MIVISKDEAYESVRKRVWYPPACDNKEEHIRFLFKDCREMEIVFCKDCRYYECGGLPCPLDLCESLGDDGFCSRGERRDE
jgi:hypothetical protein